MKNSQMFFISSAIFLVGTVLSGSKAMGAMTVASGLGAAIELLVEYFDE